MAKNLKIIFLGGVDEIGKNMTALEYSDSIIVVDAGMSFPTDDTPGIDFIVPDFSYLKSNASKVKGIFLTHGHEDHIGAVPFLAKEFPEVPIYGTALTLGLVASKFEERKVSRENLVTVGYGDVIRMEHFSVELLKVCHSIAGAAAFSIATPCGTVFFTGDYKIDLNPIDGKLTDLKRMGEIGSAGVKVLLADSTNVEEKGHSDSERSVGLNLDNLFAEYPERRIVITTFSSHNYRIQQILDLAKKHKRKVALSGRSIRKFVDIARNLGEIDAPDKIFIEQGEIKNFKPSELVIISAGSQGEPNSALSKMSLGDSKVKIGHEDLIILSASPIPGNEKLINNLINNFYRLGAEVVSDGMDDIHSSGHAYREEMKLLISILQPEFFIPVHGEYRHMAKHAELAEKVGVKSGNTIVPEIGMVLCVGSGGMRRIDNVTAGPMYVDGTLIESNGELVMRDRKALASSGLIIALLVMGKDGKLVSAPDIVTRGFSAAEGFDEDVKGLIQEAVSALEYDAENSDFNAEVKAAAKRAIKKYVMAKYKQFPVILPLITEG